jgi:molybdate transport system ATP-binding protein
VGEASTTSTDRDPAVLEFDVRVERAEFVLDVAGSFGAGTTAVFGPSGAGKSTLLGVIAGTVTPNAGHVNLNGRALFSSQDGVNLPPERRRIGFVYQDAVLFPHMTAEQNIHYGYRLTPESLRRLEPTDLADLLDITHLLGRNPADLSGGERQRVALARALATSPELLLLDEPMSALDLRLRGIVLGYLKTIHRELKMPIVYVSHSISEVVAIAGSALILSDGRAIAFDEPRHLLSRTAGEPGSEFDASLDNLLEGQVVETHSDGSPGIVKVGGARLVAPTGNRQFGEKVVLAVGAREIIIATTPPVGISARNILPGKVTSVSGDSPRRMVTVISGAEFVVEVTGAAVSQLGITPGAEVYLVIKSSSIAVMDAFRG